jgi:hypothetical protein
LVVILFFRFLGLLRRPMVADGASDGCACHGVARSNHMTRYTSDSSAFETPLRVRAAVRHREEAKNNGKDNHCAHGNSPVSTLTIESTNRSLQRLRQRRPSSASTWDRLDRQNWRRTKHSFSLGLYPMSSSGSTGYAALRYSELSYVGGTCFATNEFYTAVQHSKSPLWCDEETTWRTIL